VTRAAYKKLRAVQWIGGAVCLCVLITSWLNAVPPYVLVGVLIAFGFPASIAAWVLRDQNFEEMPY
jgi:hypothetical protein